MSTPNFLDKLTGKKATAPKSFLALVLSDTRVQAAVWNVVVSKTEIISLGTPVEWDGEVATTSELISAVDATISSATEGLELEPDEIILGLANTWVEPSGIKPSKKDLIKNICQELSLKPIGYVVISDTIVKYLKMQEGTPATSILIQVDRRSATLSLVELGHIRHTVTVNVSSDLSSDVAKALALLPSDAPLPSRFILVSGMENTSDLVQSLTAYDWLKSANFLHTPKIEALPKDVEVHATAVAGGSEVASSLGFTLASVAPPAPESLDSAPDSTPPLAPAPLLSAEDVGFAPASAPSPEPALPPTEFPAPSAAVPDELEDEPTVSDLDAPPPIPPEPSDTLPPSTTPTRPRLKLRLPSLSLPSLPHFRLPRFSGLTARPITFVLGGVLLLLAALGIFLFTVPRATITLQVKAKPVTESLALTLSKTASSVDLESRVIPGRYHTESLEGSETVPATGTKTIGDPARGEVTLYNRTTLAKTFLKGTTLTANSLKFTLDSDVTVASKSAGADYVDVPGKANVKITASSFGEAGNLKSGTEFTLASFSKDSYVAKNDAALTGGNSQEITVVAEADKKALISALTAKLTDSLTSRLKLDTSATESHYVLADDLELTSESYNHKLGEEASSLTGDLTLSLGVMTYSQADIQTLLKTEIEQAVPAGYLRSDLPPQITLTETSVSDSGDVSATAEVTLYVTPSLDTNNLSTLLKGKKYQAAMQILTALPGVTSADITLSPALPPRLLALPYNPSHITLRTLATP